MGRPHEPLHSALATLRTRWGNAAVRLGNGDPAGIRQPAMEAGPATHGALALATLYSILNKLFDLAPPVLIGAAVDIVVSAESSVLAAWAGRRLRCRNRWSRWRAAR